MEGVLANKGYQGSSASFAKGGACLHKTNSKFLKTPDHFRYDGTSKEPGGPGGDQNFAKSGANSGKGVVSAPAAKNKSLSPVKPRS